MQIKVGVDPWDTSQFPRGARPSAAAVDMLGIAGLCIPALRLQPKPNHFAIGSSASFVYYRGTLVAETFTGRHVT